ncbi:MAG: urea ABC transporter ATP-binding subunit UrtE [Pseudomonadota bacterium]
MLELNSIDLYYGASQALKDINFSAEIGKISCVLGRNGVGKSSLGKAIVNRHPTQSGTIVWDGKDITLLSSAQRAKLGIAYVPQGREIFSQLTVLENLETAFAVLPRGKRRIDDEIYDLFPVLRDMLSRRGGDLSGGQQQQLAIARALVMKPKALILDEPTEGIQPSIIKDIHEVINLLRTRGDMAIVLVEQYFEFAKNLCDDFIVMDRGEIVLSGTYEQMDETQVRALMTV